MIFGQAFTAMYSFSTAVTIYVKKEEEKVYNALMLDSLTVGDMVEAVCFLYSLILFILVIFIAKLQSSSYCIGVDLKSSSYIES